MAVLLCLLFAVGSFLKPTPAEAATGINQQINYQARLLNSQGAVVADGNYNVQFKMYKNGDGLSAGDTTGSPGGTLLWTESWQNNNSQAVVVKNGYFSVQLGAICALSGGSCQGNTNTGVDFNQSILWLSVNVGGTTAGSPSYDGEMLPMRQLAAAPYALNSNMLGGLTASQFLQLAPNTVQTDASTNNSIYVQKTGASGNVLQLQSGSTNDLIISNTGTATFQQTALSTTAFDINNSLGNSIFAVDTLNSRVGIALGSTTSPTLAGAGLEVAGALRVDTTVTDNFTTPAGSTVQTKINIPVYSPGNFSQILAFGVTSATPSTGRVLSVFDARTSAHQPSIALFTPDEANVFGLSWDGSNTTAVVKTTTNSMQLQANSTNILTLTNSSGTSLVGVGTASPTQSLEVYNGNAQLDYGNLRITEQAAPGAPTVAVGASGTLNSTYYYTVAFVTNAGQTNYGTVSSAVAPASQQVNITAIPIGTSGVVTARKIYRTKVGGTNAGPFYLVTTINDNSTTTYTDNTADGSLGVVAPSMNTSAGTGLVSVGGIAVLQSDSNSQNVLLGQTALSGNTSGVNNTAIGVGALSGNTTGSNNVGIGVNALQSNATGAGNVVIGGSTASSLANGASNTIIGYNSASNLTSGSNNIIIGPSISAPNASTSNYLNIGNVLKGNTSTGTASFQTSTDSTSALQVMNHSSSVVFDVDTTNSFVGIGQSTPSRLLDVAQNSAQVTAPMVLLEQAGSGDTSIELKNSSASFYLGQDTSNSNALSINSSTSSSIPASPTTITPVQGLNTADPSIVSSISLAFGSNVTAGNAIIAAVSWDNNATGITLSSCTDNKGNTYSVTAIIADTSATQSLGTCYATNVAAGATTVTANFSSATSFRGIAIHEYSGIAKTNPVDTTSVIGNGSGNSASGSSATDGVTAGTMTTSQNGDLIFGHTEDLSVAANAVISAGSGFTALQANATLNWLTESKVLSNSGSTAATFTYSLAHRYAASSVAFKPATVAATDANTNALFTLSQTGNAKFQTVSNSSIAFQIQNNNGASVLTADTLTGAVTIASTTNSTAALKVTNSSGVANFSVDASNGRVLVGNGNSGYATTPNVLVLNSKTDSGDPAAGVGVEGAMYYNNVMKSFRCYFNGAWHSCAGGAVYTQTSVAAGDTVANTATATAFAESYTIPGNDCISGRHYRVTASGTFGTTATPTMTLSLLWGATTMITGPALSPGTISAAGASWDFNGEIQCYSGNPNASGSIAISGNTNMYSGTSSLTTAMPLFSNGGNSITVDTTSSAAITLKAKWSAASSSNTISLREFVVEAIGP